MNDSSSGTQQIQGSGPTTEALKAENTLLWLAFSVIGLVGGLISLLAWILPICGCPMTLVTIAFSVVGILGYRKTGDKRALILGGIGLALGIICFVLTMINGVIGAYMGFNRGLGR